MQTLLPRAIEQQATRWLAHVPALIIEGARQVGKSTFAQHLTQDLNRTYVTLDDSATRTAAIADPEGFVQSVETEVLVIDEVQRAPELLLAIKAAIDRDRRPGRFVLTGSSDLLRGSTSPDSLAGRAVTLRLHPFSQGELRGYRDDFIAHVIAGFSAHRTSPTYTRNDYAASITQGGYPELRTLPADLRSQWIDSYLSRLLRRDSQDITHLTEPERLQRLLALLAANQMGELVVARLARDANLAASTTNRDLDLLEALFITDRIPPWTRNLTKRQITERAKSLVIDSALAARLNRVSATFLASLRGSDALGDQLEGFVASELRKQQTWSVHEWELSHFRDRDGLEVDLIVELSDGRVVAIEVKAGATVKPRHVTGLISLRDALGADFAAGILLNTAPTGAHLGDRLHALPISALWNLRSELLV